MKSGSPYAHLPLAAVLAVVISVGMPLLARLQRSGHDPWLTMRPPLHPVSGRVLHDGMPLAGATVSFTTVLPESDRAYGSVGTTDTDGRFWLRSPRENWGAAAGHHQVMIQKMVETGRFVTDLSFPDGSDFPELASAIPEHYGEFERSGLTAEVREDGPNEFIFSLFGPPPPLPPEPRPPWGETEMPEPTEETLDSLLDRGPAET